MSLRLRITVLTAALIAITSTIIGIATYTTVASVQLDQLDTSLKTTLGSPGIKPQNSNNPAATKITGDFANPVAIVGVNTRGDLSVVRPSWSGKDPDPLPSIPVELLDSQVQQFSTFIDPETNQSYRAATRTFPRGGILIAFISLENYQDSLNSIALRTFFIVSIATLFGGVVAWFSVRRSFRPVDEMVTAASAIVAGDTDTRMPEGAAGTELGVLGNSMNSMLDSLTDSMSQLEESENRIRTFVSDASHEIRTPLTVIRGYVELLMGGQDPSTVATGTNANSEFEKRALSRINSESLRLERLVTALLQLDLVETSQFESHEFSLTSLVRDSFDDLCELSNRTLTHDLEDITVMGTEEGWAQLISNLVQNISRYTPTDCRVGVKLERTEKLGEEWFTLLVDDSGPGIPADKRELIFDRFTRLDKARDSASGGFGLGMSIIKSIVLAHNGELELDESPMGGLRVRISAPVRPRQS